MERLFMLGAKSFRTPKLTSNYYEQSRLYFKGDRFRNLLMNIGHSSLMYKALGNMLAQVVIWDEPQEGGLDDGEDKTAVAGKQISHRHSANAPSQLFLGTGK